MTPALMISKAAERSKLLKEMKRVRSRIHEVGRFDVQEANELREYLAELQAQYGGIESELQARFKELSWEE